MSLSYFFNMIHQCNFKPNLMEVDYEKQYIAKKIYFDRNLIIRMVVIFGVYEWGSLLFKIYIEYFEMCFGRILSSLIFWNVLATRREDFFLYQLHCCHLLSCVQKWDMLWTYLWTLHHLLRPSFCLFFFVAQVLLMLHVIYSFSDVLVVNVWCSFFQG